MSEEPASEDAGEEPSSRNDGPEYEEQPLWPPYPPPPPPAHRYGNGDPNSGQRSPEPPNWVEKGTLVALVLTLIAAGVAAYEADRLAYDTEIALSDARDSARTAHGDNLQALSKASAANAISQAAKVAGDRAWLVPYKLTFGTPTVGKPLDVQVEIQNIGKGPAQDILTYGGVAVKVMPTLVPHMGDQGDLFWQSCKTIQPTNGAKVVYPGLPDYEVMHGYQDWTPELQNGSATLVWNICFAYRTEGQVHRSARCFFYRKGMTTMSHFSQCGGGDFAD
jgi:hypothetical protein